MTAFRGIPALAAAVRLALLGVLLLLGTPAAAEEIIKSPSDHRNFKYLELANGMKVVLVSDPDTDKAAASLDVGIGSSSDPAMRQGLAHFLEHMLFLGTAKYPQAGEYDDFMNAHGGRHNAYTSFENTNYHFEIDKNFLEPALDRFSQFFVAPLFTADYVQREKNAVHSEYKARIKDDDRRQYSVLQQIVNPAHPFSKFAVGSLETLSDRNGSAIRDELLQFYRTHYSANLMTLAVIGKEPLPVLEKWVTERFAQVENRQSKRLSITAPLFEPGQLPLRLNIEPLRDERELKIYFPIPAVTAHYRVKPVDYIANLVGHEGEGSLLSLLKAKGWAEQLGAGLGRDDSDGAALSLSIQLTQTGLAHVDDIIGLVFQMLRLIEREGVAHWRYEEQARLSRIAFQFDQKDSPLDTVIDIAQALGQVAPKDVLQAPFLMEAYDESLIRRYLGYLRPDNMLMVVVARNLHFDTHDRWYDTAYSAMPVSATQTAAWQTTTFDTALRLPPANPFIPEHTVLKAPESAPSPIPRRIFERPGFELWFKQDDTFHQPRADFYFSVRSPVANDSPDHAVRTSLYTRLVAEQLNEFTYAAQLAGLRYSLYPHIRGFTVRISGYDDKLPLLLTHIVDALQNPLLASDVLEREKTALIQSLENVRHENPYEQTLAEVAKLLVRPAWSEVSRIEAARKVSVEDMRRFVPELLRDVEVIALAHGNLDRNDTMALGNTLYHALVKHAHGTAVAPGQVVQLDAGSHYARDLAIAHPDSAVVAYFQGADRSESERARFELLAQILESPFYNDLRTEKQLGYIVSAGSLPLLEVPGISFLVQSPVTTAANLEAQVEQFIARYKSAIDAMPEALFESHRDALVARLMVRDERLQSRTDRYWNELDFQHYRFDTRAQLAAAVRAITLADFRAFYQRILLDGRRRSLVVRSNGTDQAASVAADHNAMPEISILDPDNFAVGKVFVPNMGPGQQPPGSIESPATSVCSSTSDISRC